MIVHRRTVACALAIAWLASGCASMASQGVATPLPVVADLGGVRTEGRLEPIRFVHLAPVISGQVSEVLVSEGDQVEAGQILVKFESTEARTLEQARNEAAAELGTAYESVRMAQKALDEYRLPRVFVGLTAEEASRTWLHNLDAARVEFQPYKDTSRKALKPRHVLNEFVYPSMPRRVVVDTHDYDEMAMVYKKQLDVAWTNYTKAVQWLKLDAALSEAQARASEAQHRYESLQSDPESAPGARGTQLAFATAELRSPFAGTVTQMDLRQGEVAAAGVTVATIADLSSWIVRTTDLTEIDVTAVTVGMPVSVVFDSMPDTTLKGRVVSVDLNYADRQGDILYPVEVLLADASPQLRWGMTAEVTFTE